MYASMLAISSDFSLRWSSIVFSSSWFGARVFMIWKDSSRSLWTFLSGCWALGVISKLGPVDTILSHGTRDASPPNLFGFIAARSGFRWDDERNRDRFLSQLTWWVKTTSWLGTLHYGVHCTEYGCESGIGNGCWRSDNPDDVGIAWYASTMTVI